MDLEKLNAVDTSNPAAVKELQTFLKSRDYYKGPIDGKWGGGTTEGAGKLRADLMDTAKVARDTAVANQETNSPLNNALRGATEFGPYAVGGGLGMYGGHKGAQGMSKLWGRHAAETANMAGDPNISGTAAKAQMGSMRTARNTATGAQFLAPAALLGSAEYIRGHIAPKFEGETKKWIDLGANLDQGAGLGLATHQLVDLKNRIASPATAADEALISTRATAERTPPPPPPPPPGTRANSDRLTAAARAAGATGKLTKASAAEFLANNVTDANRAAVLAELPPGTTGRQLGATVRRLASRPGSSMIIGPLVGGVAAYDAVSSQAQAEGATPGAAQAQGAAAGTATGAGVAGAGYGISKVLDKFPNFGKALGIGGAMSVPSLAADAYDPSQEKLNMDRNQAARNFPSWMRGGEVENAYQMAQVPERNTGKVDPFATARGLPEPTGGPMPGPNGEPAYPDPEWLQAMMQQAALGAGPRIPQPPMPQQQPRLPYGAMGFGGRF
jgi:hypothetical protein